jgi:hypothetical protein
MKTIGEAERRYKDMPERGQAVYVMSGLYTSEQIEAIEQEQSGKHRLATELAFETGLSSYEIPSLRPPGVRSADRVSYWDEQLFMGRKKLVPYTVLNAEGESRRIAVSEDLADKIELARLTRPKVFQEGNWRELCGYRIGYGIAWIDSFMRASEIALGLSLGVHGLRHAYILNRFFELMAVGFSRKDRIAILAIETGMHEPKIERLLSSPPPEPDRNVS